MAEKYGHCLNNGNPYNDLLINPDITVKKWRKDCNKIIAVLEALEAHD